MARPDYNQEHLDDFLRKHPEMRGYPPVSADKEAYEKVLGATLQLRELGYTATADEGSEGLAYYEATIERLRLDVARAETFISAENLGAYQHEVECAREAS